MRERLAVFFVLSLMAFGVSAKTIYVFSPLETRANVIQNMLNQQCEDTRFVVFGRAADFHAQMATVTPAGILALPPVIESHKKFKTFYRGVKRGEVTEPYVLVSVNKPVDLARLSGSKVGAFDLLGRNAMDNYIGSQLMADVKVKRVVQYQALLALLSYDAVDAIYTSDSLFEKMKATTKLDLVATTIRKKQGLISLALSDASARAEINSCISNFDDEINTMLGVEKWKAL
ncbi:hypothetical protein OAV62_01395 [bacterium]|nr:hypothetical protein [bacterium]